MLVARAKRSIKKKWKREKGGEGEEKCGGEERGVVEERYKRKKRREMVGVFMLGGE